MIDLADNPQAFPCPTHIAHSGMTLRDWFAGQAIPAIVRSTAAGQHNPARFQKGTDLIEAMAADAYDLADAMLAARAKGGTDAK